MTFTRRGAAVLVRAQSDNATPESSPNSNPAAWLGRAAMLLFVAALAVEVVTGRGVLETVGVTAPLQAPGLLLAGVAGLTTAFGIFRSISTKN